MLLGVSGGIAAYKAARSPAAASRAGADVTVVMTASADRFVGADTFAALTGKPVHTVAVGAARHGPARRLAHEADVAVVAPATANVLAKLAHGLADDLLTVDAARGRLPARDRARHAHRDVGAPGDPRQRRDARRARASGSSGPVSGPLAHGDEGMGRLAEPEDIVAAVEAAARARAGPRRDAASSSPPGPTHEPLDPVRFIGNRSSGKMGVALAAEAVARGADVHAGRSGPGIGRAAGRRATSCASTTAEEMRAPSCAEVAGGRRRRDGRRRRRLPSRSAVAEQAQEGVGRARARPRADARHPARAGRAPRRRPVLVGFAAETADLEAAGRQQARGEAPRPHRRERGGREPAPGSASDTNDAMILAADGADEPLADVDEARARRARSATGSRSS